MRGIVTRLRAWRELHLTRLGDLMDEAADEIERLRQWGRLTDAEAALLGRIAGTLESDADAAVLRYIRHRLTR